MTLTGSDTQDAMAKGQVACEPIKRRSAKVGRYAVALSIGVVFPLVYWYLLVWTSVLWISWGYLICIQWALPEWCYWALPPWLAVHAGVVVLPSRLWRIILGPVLFVVATANNGVYQWMVLSQVFGVTEWQEIVKVTFLNVEWNAIPAGTAMLLGVVLSATTRRK